MTDLTVWWDSDATFPVGTGWPFVVRGKRGICYSLPARRNGWIVRKRWEDGDAPTSEPIPDRIARLVGGRLGLPGCVNPSDRELAEVAEWILTEMAAIGEEVPGG